jgi:hypothetical protein
VQLHKLVADVERDVQEGGPVGVARDLQPLHRRQPRVRVPPQLRRACRGAVSVLGMVSLQGIAAAPMHEG